MDIKCKYSLGDKVYYMKENKARSGIIEEVRIRATLEPGKGSLPLYDTKIDVVYNTEDTKGLSEDKIFGSKEELLNSL